MGEESRHEIKHILLGMLVIGLTVALFLLSYQSGPKGEAAGYLLSARFNATDGISVGSDVQGAEAVIDAVQEEAGDQARCVVERVDR